MGVTRFTAVDNSTIWDVCLNTYGSVNEIVKLMTDNGYENVNTYPRAGQIFFFDDTLVENQNNLQTDLASSKFATMGGVGGTIAPNDNTMGIFYSEAFEAEYVSNSDGVTGINLAGIIPVGAKMVQIEKEIKPISTNDYLWNPSSVFLTLLNGVTVDNGQTLFIIYKVIQTS